MQKNANHGKCWPSPEDCSTPIAPNNLSSGVHSMDFPTNFFKSLQVNFVAGMELDQQHTVAISCLVELLLVQLEHGVIRH